MSDKLHDACENLALALDGMTKSLVSSDTLKKSLLETANAMIEEIVRKIPTQTRWVDKSGPLN